MQDNELISSLKEKRDILSSRIRELKLEVELLTNRISKLEENSSLDPSNSNLDLLMLFVYDPNWTIKDKVLFFIRKEMRFLHFREIAEFICSAENLTEDPIVLATKISAASKQIKLDGIIVKYQIGNSSHATFWGMPEWLDDHGLIRAGYEYDPKFASIKRVRKKLD